MPFFELVLYPAKASAQVAELYITVGRNRLYASQGRASTNDLAAQARTLFSGRCQSLERLQPQSGTQQMGPHDGPNPHRIHLVGETRRRM